MKIDKIMKILAPAFKKASLSNANIRIDAVL